MMQYKKNIEEITKKAGSYLLSHFGNLIEQHHKSDTHYDTVDDKIVSDLYKQYLLSAYPTYGFYSEEETGDISQFEYSWMIDPIEGTTNYSHNIPFFATQIALLHRDEVVASGVYLPVQNEMYYAEIGQGSFCNDIRLHVSPTQSLDKAILSIGKGTGVPNLTWWGNTNQKLAPKSRTLRFIGATGIDLCYVSAGKLDLHLNHGSQNYDYAPGSLIAREAGAKVTNFKGEPWKITDSDIIVGNSKLVEQVLANI